MEEKFNSFESKPTLKEKISLPKKLFSLPEGRIFVVGIFLAFFYILWLVLSFFWSPEKGQLFVGMTATAILFGRAAGMSFGYSMGLGHEFVIPISMLVETLLVLFFYPLFVFSWNSLLVLPFLKKFFEKTHQSAEKHRETIQRYGLPGLFLFVWFPFWMTGPLIGSVIAFLLGFRHWVTVTIVLVGTYIAVLSWAVLLRGLHERVAAFSPYGPMVLLAIVIVVVLGGLMLQAVRKENGFRKKKKV